MKGRNTTTPKNKTNLLLKRVFIFAIIASASGGLYWKFFLGGAATVATHTITRAQMTPGVGPTVSGGTWEGTLVVNHNKVIGSSDYSDFAVLVSMTHDDLKSTAHGGFVENPNGWDILFAGMNDSQLIHEIESYDPTTGELIAWVQVPVLYHSVNTEFKIMAGNPTINSDQSSSDTWSNGAVSVWHMGQDPADYAQIDSKSSFNAHPNGSMNSNDLVNGQIGSAIEFDGYNDFLSIEGKHFDIYGEIDQLTVTAWVKTDHYSSSWTGNWSILDFDRSEYFNFFVHGDGRISFCDRSAGGGIEDFHAGYYGQVNDGRWHHVAATYDGDKKRLFVDGVLISTVDAGEYIGSGTTRYGFIGDGSEAHSYNGNRNNRYFKGSLDEIRMYQSYLTEDRITTEYNNQSDPQGFVSLSTTTALPIELTSFDAEMDGDYVKTFWSVATQQDNDFFTIERSTDGKSFEAIGTVDGEGTTLESMDYEFIDYEPVLGVNYYRLMQTDFDGKFEKFHVVAVDNGVSLDEVTLDKIYPNPFSDQMTIEYTVGEEADIQISLVNSSGLTVFSDIQRAQVGTNHYRVYSDYDLSRGMYFVHISQNGQVLANSKVIKR